VYQRIFFEEPGSIILVQHFFYFSPTFLYMHHVWKSLNIMEVWKFSGIIGVWKPLKITWFRNPENKEGFKSPSKSNILSGFVKTINNLLATLNFSERKKQLQTTYLRGFKPLKKINTILLKIAFSCNNIYIAYFSNDQFVLSKFFHLSKALTNQFSF